MVSVNSTMLPLGTEMPEFQLPDFDGNSVSSKDFAGAPATLVMFICNHCPYVRHVRPEIARLTREYQEKGVAVFGINSNDIEAYPDDDPAHMREEAKTAGYTFPYLLDDTQGTALAFRAACTPDFFLFDAERRLAYRGRMDDTRPNSGREPNGSDLRAALDDVLAGKPVAGDQVSSVGCNIKWKSGKAPEYAP